MMRNPRRPSASSGHASDARDRPVSWSRRMEEARESRARVLAAREAQREGAGEASAAYEPPGEPDTIAEKDGPSPTDEVPSRSKRYGIERFPWRLASVFSAATAGVIALAFGFPEADDFAPEPNPLVVSAPSEPGPDMPPLIVPELPPPAGDAGVTQSVERPEHSVPAEVALAPAAANMARDAAITVADPRNDSSEVVVPIRSAPRPLVRSDESSVAELQPAETSPEAVPAPAEVESEEDNAASSEEVVTEVEAAVAEALRPRANSEFAALQVEQPAPLPELAASEDVPLGGTSPPEARPGENGIEPDSAQANEEAEGPAPSASDGFLIVNAAPGVSPEDLDDVLGRLSAAGYPVARSVRVDFLITQTNVRYFHAGDAELAAGVAEAISGISRDFTDYRPSPGPGMIEVWLAG